MKRMKGMKCMKSMTCMQKPQTGTAIAPVVVAT
jgi:hypothetical protein